MKKLVFAIFGLAICFSWTVISDTPMKKVNWLIGTWENKTSRGSMYEAWTKISETELSGKSYVIKEKDTVVFESIKLVEENSNLFYIPTVKDQNNGLPVRFALKTLSDTAMVFENSAHDFPQVIRYVKINADSLMAEVSGIKNGQERKQAFPMKRVK